MKLIYFMILFTSFNVWCKDIVEISSQEGFAKKEDCPIHLSFGSFGSGISYQTLTSIKELLVKFEGLSIEKWHWGLEGEVDFCIKSPSEKQLKKIQKKS